MTLAKRVLDRKSDGKAFFVSERCHPQTIELVRTRAIPLHIPVIVGDHAALDPAATPVFAALVQYPTSDGEVLDYGPFVERLHAIGALAVVAADPLALTLLASSAPTSWSAAPSASASRWGTAARTPATWRRATPTSATSPAA